MASVKINWLEIVGLALISMCFGRIWESMKRLTSEGSLPPSPLKLIQWIMVSFPFWREGSPLYEKHIAGYMRRDRRPKEYAAYAVSK